MRQELVRQSCTNQFFRSKPSIRKAHIKFGAHLMNYPEKKNVYVDHKLLVFSAINDVGADGHFSVSAARQRILHSRWVEYQAVQSIFHQSSRRVNRSSVLTMNVALNVRTHPHGLKINM